MFIKFGSKLLRIESVRVIEKGIKFIWVNNIDGDKFEQEFETEEECNETFNKLEQQLTCNESVLLEDTIEIYERKADMLKYSNEYTEYFRCGSCMSLINYEDVFCKTCGARLVK